MTVPVHDIPFRGAKLKIERAQHHLINLHSIETAFFKGDSSELVIEPDPKTGGKVAKVRSRSAVPDDAYILTGEIIFHLRSSLDQLIISLGEISTEKPALDSVYFPTGTSAKDYANSCARNMAGFDQDFIDLVGGFKAYDGGDDMLRAVFPLANIDKHLKLIPIATTGQVSGVSNWNVYNGTFIFGGPPESLYDGIVLLELAHDGTVTPRNSDAKIEIAGQIAFGNVSKYKNLPVVALLNSSLQSVIKLHNEIVDLCHRTGRLAKFAHGGLSSVPSR